MSKIRLAVGLTLTMLLASACAVKPPDKTPTRVTTADKQTHMMKVIVASGKRDQLIYLPAVIAEQLGYLREEGLSVEFRDTYKGGQSIAQAVVAGEADFGLTVPDNVVKFKTQGIDLVLIASLTRLPGVALIVDSRHKDTIKSVKDLRGKRVGVTSPGSGSHQAIVALLEREGMRADDVEIMGVGFELGKAFYDGTVVAGANYDPVITDLIMSKKGFLISSDLRHTADVVALYGSEYPFSSVIAMKEAVRKNPEKADRLVKALVKANQWIVSHSPSEIAEKVPADLKGSDEIFMAAVTNSKETFSPDGKIDTKGMETVLKALRKQKVIPEAATVDPASLIDMTFVTKAGK